MDLAPAWMVAIIIGREFAVTALRTLAHARGATMPASPLGKIKMVAQVVAILALILGKDHLHGFFVIGQIALWVVVVTALVSAADYFRRFGMFLNPKVVPLPTRAAEAHAGPKGAVRTSWWALLALAGALAGGFLISSMRLRAASRCSLCSNSSTSLLEVAAALRPGG